MLQEQSSNLWAISARKLLLLINHEHCAIPHHILSWLTCIFAKLLTYTHVDHVSNHSYAFSHTLFQDGKQVPHCCVYGRFDPLAGHFFNLKQNSEYWVQAKTPKCCTKRCFTRRRAACQTCGRTKMSWTLVRKEWCFTLLHCVKNNTDL